jgi:hypothetical protein
MARLVLVAVITALALVNAQSDFPTVCPTSYTCAAVGASCFPTSPLNSVACTQSDEVYNSNYTACICSIRPIVTDSSVLGGTCFELYSSSPAYVHTCRKSDVNQGPGQQPLLKWYLSSSKYIGDVCTSDYQCSPPRQCISGKCAANLALGDVCKNTTVFTGTFPNYGMCSTMAYCPQYNITTQDSLELSYCTPKLALGATCYVYDDKPCAGHAARCLSTSNVYPSSAWGTCVLEQFNFVLPGMRANDSRQCTSGYWNGTTQLCLDRDAIIAAGIVNLGADCTYDSDCSSLYAGTTVSHCACNGGGAANKAVCKSSVSNIATLAQRQAARATELANYQKLWVGGCESYTGSTQTTDYCGFRAGVTYTSDGSDSDSFAEACAIYRARKAAGVPDCDGILTAYCGALHTMTVSMVSIVAMALFAWLGPKA